MIERLEPRHHFAVEAFVDHGTLIVRGSDGNDTVSIFRGDHPTSLQLSTSTDGEGRFESLRTFTGVRRGLRIDTGAGDDLIQLQGLRVFGSIQIDGGPGDDQLIIRSTRPTGSLIWRGGDGDDSVLIRQSTIQRNMLLDGGAGKDHTYLSFVHARENVRIQDTDGPSIITFTRLSVDGNAQIAAGASLDRLTIHDSTFKSDATITTSRGDDRIRVRGTVFRQTPILDASEGDNHIDREIILEWDFNNGAQGWEAGFADYPAGVIGTKPDGTPLTGEEALELQSGIEPLPEELGVSGKGFKQSGNNSSDDLFMYVAKQLGEFDGLVAGTQYIISYSIKYATDLPAESMFNPRYFKVGGVPHVPEIAPDPEDEFPPIIYRLNADIGNQGNSGAEASIAGFMHNDLDVPYELWASTRRAHTHPVPIMANGDGRLWLLAGVDSAYETVATIFYQTVNVRLTPASSLGP